MWVRGIRPPELGIPKLVIHFRTAHHDRFVPQCIAELPGVTICPDCKQPFTQMSRHKACRVRKGKPNPDMGHLHENYDMGQARNRGYFEWNDIRDYLGVLLHDIPKRNPNGVVVAFTDGSSHRDLHVGGTGIYMMGPSKADKERPLAWWLGAPCPRDTTNNAAELLAVGHAMDAAIKFFDDTVPLVVLTDSQFVIGALIDHTDVGPEN